MLEIRADFAQPALQKPDQQQWVASPQPGVERVMLDRVGDEVAVATSLVRYAPNSAFPDHEHALGEEFIVLQGEFADEHGRYPAGSYLRNPPGTHHAPFSEPGCLIWVKLRQFDLADQRQCALSLDAEIPATGAVARELHRHAGETVRELAAAAGAEITLAAAPDVQELLVLAGEIRWGAQVVGPFGWIRIPAGAQLAATALSACRLFTKTRPFYRPLG